MPAKSAAARARAEVQTGNGGTKATLKGQSLSVLPTGQWRASAVRALADGNFDLWAQGCLTPQSYTVWQGIDPTIEECTGFFAAWREATGQNEGESAAS